MTALEPLTGFWLPTPALADTKGRAWPTYVLDLHNKPSCISESAAIAQFHHRARVRKAFNGDANWPFHSWVSKGLTEVQANTVNTAYEASFKCDRPSQLERLTTDSPLCSSYPLCGRSMSTILGHLLCGPGRDWQSFGQLRPIPPLSNRCRRPVAVQIVFPSTHTCAEKYFQSSSLRKIRRANCVYDSSGQLYGCFESPPFLSGLLTDIWAVQETRILDD